MSIQTKHDDCPTCEWLSREAVRTAIELGRDAWTSWTLTPVNPREHWAYYEEEE